MSILQAEASPKELVGFLEKLGVRGIDIDAMEIPHHPTHAFERSGKKFYVIILFEGPYRRYVEMALEENNRDFRWG